MKHYILATLMIFAGFSFAMAQKPHATYYENGKKKSQGNLDGSTKLGEWVYYYDNGNKKAEGVYKDGHKYGSWTTYYKNGDLKSEGNYAILGAEAVKHGDWTWYHKNGAVMKEGKFMKGKPKGLWKEYNTLGIETSKKTY